MNGNRENKAIDVKREKMRRKVREMEAFGWILDETEDMKGKMVKLNFRRSLNMPNINKLRKLEYDLSRLPKENSAFNLKFIAGVVVCTLIATVSATGSKEPLIAVIIGVVVFEILFLLLIAIMNPEYKKLSKRRDRILYRAGMLSELRAESGSAISKQEDIGIDEQELEDN